MNSTPRLRSAFPQTPQTGPRKRSYYETPSRQTPRPQEPQTRRPVVPQDTNSPLIPFEVLDAPSQRLYAVAFYAALNAWRVYDSYTTLDDLDSTWLFLKWVAIDGVVLFGLQALRIPWLEWAFPTTLAAFLVHVVCNIFLMFRIPVSRILISDFASLLTC